MRWFRLPDGSDSLDSGMQSTTCTDTPSLWCSSFLHSSPFTQGPVSSLLHWCCSLHIRFFLHVALMSLRRQHYGWEQAHVIGLCVWLQHHETTSHSTFCLSEAPRVPQEDTWERCRQEVVLLEKLSMSSSALVQSHGVPSLSLIPLPSQSSSLCCPLPGHIQATS